MEEGNTSVVSCFESTIQSTLFGLPSLLLSLHISCVLLAVTQFLIFPRLGRILSIACIVVSLYQLPCRLAIGCILP